MLEKAFFEDTHKKLGRLSEAVLGYEAFAKKFEGNPTVWVKKAFSGDDNEHPKLIISPPPPDDLDITQEWDAFLEQTEYQNKAIVRMIRRGLTMGKGVLLKHPDFMNFIALQPAHPRVYKWLHASVWRFCILQDAPLPNGDVWFRCLETMNNALLGRLPLPNNLTQIQDQQKTLAHYKRWLKDGKHVVYIDQLVQKIVSALKTKQSNEQNVLNEIKSSCFQHLALTLYADEYIVQRSFDVYFTQCFNDYMKNRTPQNREALRFLLRVFCDLFTLEGTRRFALIFKALESHFSPQEQELIKEVMGNPREDEKVEKIKDKWNLLKSGEYAIYREILYWFLKSDFEQVLDFLFRNEVDEHGRKELWMPYLRYADDLQAFLSEMELNHFIRLQNNKQLTTTIQPLINKSNPECNGFVILSKEVAIYEARETGNASYIYNREVLNFAKDTSSQTVKQFLSQAFSRKKQNPQTVRGTSEVNTKHLIHTSLAEKGNNITYFHKDASPHWRFKHYKNKEWHNAVNKMLKDIYKMEARKEST